MIARRAMVATGHPLASAAGIEVLSAGGNAVDAAVAVAAVLGVAQPMMSGLGGDTFMLVYLRRQDRVWGLNGGGPAPLAATAELFRGQGLARVPGRGTISASVPGAVAAMEKALSLWGSGRFSLGRLLDPAIRYAEEGVPVAPHVAGWIRESAPILAEYPSSAAVFLPGGLPPAEGDVLVQTDLGGSLREVASGGADAFYRGRLAHAICDYCRGHGGLLSAEDFARFGVEEHAPLQTTYHGVTVCTTAPPSQGFLLLEMLNILEGYEQEPWGSADGIHWAVEAKKLAFADRLAYLGDPLFVPSPVEALLDKSYAARRRREIDPGRAAKSCSGGLRTAEGGNTTYFCVADVEGNLVSYITSLSALFGCGDLVEGTGIMLNNRAGRGFLLAEGHPNCIAPGKRTMHTLTPYMALRDGVPWLVWGTPGGDAQPQWNLQVLQNLLHSGMDLQAAIEAPRWRSFPGADAGTLGGPFELRVEEGFPRESLEELARRGHVLAPMGALEGGGAQAVLVDRSRGIYVGGSDPRVDGCAVGL